MENSDAMEKINSNGNFERNDHDINKSIENTEINNDTTDNSGGNQLKRKLLYSLFQLQRYIIINFACQYVCQSVCNTMLKCDLLGFYLK